MSADTRREVAEVRNEWLGRALSTEPADRPAAEAAISELYRLAGFDPPRFHWVASPVTAVMTTPPGLRPRHDEPPDRPSEWPLARGIYSLVLDLSLRLDARIREARRPGDGHIQPQEVRDPLLRSYRSTLQRCLSEAYERGVRLGVFWTGIQSVAWLAEYDAQLRRFGATFAPELRRGLDLWTTLAGACGPWWPRRDVCVVSERPTEIHTEVAGDLGEVRLHREDGPAVRYRDGWALHLWHGTRVPSWVIDDLDIGRIEREENIEVRRCAIERIGWPAYIDGAGLNLLGAAPDPGNSGYELRLYDMRRNTRILLAVNGSLERDGTRRRYGLAVPGHLTDPLAAAGWTYGLSADQYATLARRT